MNLRLRYRDDRVWRDIPPEHSYLSIQNETKGFAGWAKVGASTTHLVDNNTSAYSRPDRITSPGTGRLSSLPLHLRTND